MFNPFHKVRRSAKHATLRQRLGVSRLESREVPSTVALMGRDLIIDGTRGDDVIEVWGRWESEFVPETSKDAANAILPGWIETEMTAPHFAYEKFRANVMPRIPMRRWGAPADFGGIAVYLASAASAYHTGDEIMIDGGYWVF